MLKKTEYTCVFFSGGVIYNLIELVYRGYTHWSMTLAGGVCFLLIHLFNHRLGQGRIFLKCVLGCAVITALEFAVGVIVNLVLHLDVWDYSDMRGNVLGQICPLFSLAWFLITYPACLASNAVKKLFRQLEKNESDTTVKI